MHIILECLLAFSFDCSNIKRPFKCELEFICVGIPWEYSCRKCRFTLDGRWICFEYGYSCCISAITRLYLGCALIALICLTMLGCAMALPVVVVTLRLYSSHNLVILQLYLSYALVITKPWFSNTNCQIEEDHRFLIKRSKFVAIRRAWAHACQKWSFVLIYQVMNICWKAFRVFENWCNLFQQLTEQWMTIGQSERIWVHLHVFCLSI